jgi:hypothetical protein
MSSSSSRSSKIQEIIYCLHVSTPFKMIHSLILLPLGATIASAAFTHPGLLHTTADLDRITTHVTNDEAPWSTTWDLLTSNAHAQSDYTPNPQATIYRGDDGTHDENYSVLFNDAAAAYQLAVRWLISGDTAYADAAIGVLDAWASTLTAIGGSSDKYLAAGLYGYQLANAAELMRAYDRWSADGVAAVGTMLQTVFAAMNEAFLNEHNGQDEFHYYANWDLCNIASLMAIGVFTDNATAYDFAVEYFRTGPSNGALPVFIIANYTEDGSDKVLSQGQEAGRDQGHASLDAALLGVVAQQAYNQGDDLFATYENSILNACVCTDLEITKRN